MLEKEYPTLVILGPLKHATEIFAKAIEERRKARSAWHPRDKDQVGNERGGSRRVASFNPEASRSRDNFVANIFLFPMQPKPGETLSRFTEKAPWDGTDRRERVERGVEKQERKTEWNIREGGLVRQEKERE